MVDTPFHNGHGALTLIAVLLLGGTAQAGVGDFVASLTPGGELTLTSDYIYRGVSQSDGHGAVQGDLHVATQGGTFLGVWASSRDTDLEPGASAVMEAYLGHRFNLSTLWNVTLSGRAYHYLGADSYVPSDDYQEIAASLTYLDSWAVSITCIPNAVRYWFYTRLSRAPAWVADTSGQYLLGRQFFITAGAGYYRSQGTGTGEERATGYAYGNAGVAWEHGPFRADLGYFLTQDAAARSFPYPTAQQKFAGTVSWRF
ncbi:MAG TPA: TorF family putative porin [Steroidobacteraceae bacterium]